MIFFSAPFSRLFLTHKQQLHSSAAINILQKEDLDAIF